MPGIFDSVSGWLRDRFRGGRVVTPRTETAREAAFNERLLNLLDEDAPETRAAATSINEYTRDRIRESMAARHSRLPDPIPDTELAVPPATLEDFVNSVLGEPHSVGSTGATGPLPAWEHCTCCDDFWCHIHEMHVHDCPCPPIEEWDMDPYTVSAMPPVAYRTTTNTGDPWDSVPAGADGVGMYATTDDDAPPPSDDENDDPVLAVGTPGTPGPPAVSDTVMAALTASIIARMQPITGGVIDGDVQERQRLRVLQELQAALVDLGVAAPLSRDMIIPRPTVIAGENPRTVTVVDGRTIPWVEATAPVLRWYADGLVATHTEFWMTRTTTGELGDARYWVPTFWYTLLFSTDVPDYRTFMNYGLRNVFTDLILEMDEDVLFGLQVIMRARINTWTTTRTYSGWMATTHAQMFLSQLDRVFGDDTPVRPMGVADAMQALESESAQYDFSRDWPIRPVPLPTVNDLPPIDPSEGRNHRAIDS